MQVVTLTPQLLIEAATRLSARVQQAGVAPDLIIGIQSGGAEVARLMRSAFPAAHYCEVRLSRPSTRQKQQGTAHRLLQHLPLWLCNLLRMVESRVNEWRSRSQQPVRIGQVQLPDGVTQMLRSHPDATLLLVDDAIDTGATIQQALQQLRGQFPQAQVRVAVITVTTAHPLCEADFCLYHNRTLCRFPWSNDYR